MQSFTVYSTACPYCGGSHGLRCPEVKAVEYYPDGTIKRVEYVTLADRFQPLQPAAPYEYPYTYPDRLIVGDPVCETGGTLRASIASSALN